MLVLLVVILGASIFAPELVGELDLGYTDLEYVNHVRDEMNIGNGAIFDDGSVTKIGSGLLDTISSFAIGLYFFFFSLNPTQIDSFRPSHGST